MKPLFDSTLLSNHCRLCRSRRNTSSRGNWTGAAESRCACSSIQSYQGSCHSSFTRAQALVSATLGQLMSTRITILFSSKIWIASYSQMNRIIDFQPVALGRVQSLSIVASWGKLRYRWGPKG